MTKDKLTDKRPGFIRIDNVVFTDCDLTPHEFMVYAALCFHADYTTGESWPGLRLLQKECKMSRPKLVACIEALEQKRLIKVERQTDPDNEKRNLTNHYFIQDANRVVNHVYQGVVNDVYQGGKPRLPKQESINKNHSIADKSAADIEPTKSKKQTTIPAAQMNPMKDAIAATFGIDWQTATKNEIGMVQKAARELCEAGRVPENVATIYRYCEQQFTSAFTPMALTKHATAAMNEYESQTARFAQAQHETVEEVPPEVRQANAAAMRETFNKMRREASA